MSIARLRFGPGDTLHVLGDGKISLYAPNGDFVRTSSGAFAATPQGMTVLSDGSYVLLGTAGGTGLPIHVIGADGAELRSFAPRHTS